MFDDPTVFRSLASLHRAGVPWPQAVLSAAPGRAETIDVAERLRNGRPLSEALHPLVDPLDRAMLRAGEETGRLETTLERIATRHEEERRLRSTRLTSMLYPILVCHLGAVLIGLPDLIAGRPLAALLWAVGILAPLYAALWAIRPRQLRRDAHPGTRAPSAVFPRRSAIEEADVRALLALGDGYDSGLRLDETLALAGGAGAGGRVAFDVHRARPRVADGEPLHTAWHAVPREMAEALRVGEETGELGEAARRQAAQLQFGLEMRRKKIAVVAPLVVILAVAGIVAWRVISFYTGLYGNLDRYGM